MFLFPENNIGIGVNGRHPKPFICMVMSMLDNRIRSLEELGNKNFVNEKVYDFEKVRTNNC
jgi:hypothetical protein